MMKSRGGLGREVRSVPAPLSPVPLYFSSLSYTPDRSPLSERLEQAKAFPLSPLLLPRFYFSALLFTSHRSPLSERLEQATFALTFAPN